MTERLPLVIIDGQVQELPSGDSIPGAGGSASYPDFTDNAGKVLAVNATETGVEWSPFPSFGGSLYNAVETTITSLTSDVVIDLTTFDEVLILFEQYTPGTSNPVKVTFSSDNGATYESSYIEAGAHAGSIEFYTTTTAVEITYGGATNLSHGGRYRIENIAAASPTTMFGYFATNTYNTFKTAFASASAHTHMKLSNGGNGFTGALRIIGIKYGTTVIPALGGKAGKVLAVNTAEDGLEWVDADPDPVFNAQTGTSYTLVEADFGGVNPVTCTNTAANTVLVPAGITSKKTVTVIQTGAGSTSFVADTGVTILSADGMLGLRTQYSSAMLMPTGVADTYYLVGDLV